MGEEAVEYRKGQAEMPTCSKKRVLVSTYYVKLRDESRVDNERKFGQRLLLCDRDKQALQPGTNMMYDAQHMGS